MSIKLKIKSKHLSEEARIIRFEEYKLKKKVDYKKRKHKAAGHIGPYEHWKDIDYRKWSSLNHHRKWDVRNENRATFLARAYIAGVPYNQIEQKRKECNEYTFRVHIIPRIASMVAKYGPNKIPKKVWEKERKGLIHRKEVTNPNFIELEKNIIEWSKI